VRKKRFRRIDPGFALIFVLNGVAFLGVLMLVLAGQARTSADLAHNFREETVMLAQAQAALAIAADRLTAREAHRRWRADGSSRPITFSGHSFDVRVQDIAGLININHADEISIEKALAGSGLTEDLARGLAAQIADWRDADSEARPGGAEASEYAALGRPDQPSNSDFVALEELKSLPDMSPEVFRRVRPMFTTFGQHSEINLNVAPLQVLLAVFGRDSPSLSALLDAREGVGAASVPLAVDGSALRTGLSRQTGDAYRPEFLVTVVFPTTNDDSALFEGVIRFESTDKGRKMAVAVPMYRTER
jgi:general secretion pathway protein K